MFRKQYFWLPSERESIQAAAPSSQTPLTSGVEGWTVFYCHKVCHDQLFSVLSNVKFKYWVCEAFEYIMMTSRITISVKNQNICSKCFTTLFLSPLFSKAVEYNYLRPQLFTEFDFKNGCMLGSDSVG